MRKIEVFGSRELDRIMKRLQSVHQPVVVALPADSGNPDLFLFAVYYLPHTNFRLEDWGEKWDTNGSFVS